MFCLVGKLLLTYPPGDIFFLFFTIIHITHYFRETDLAEKTRYPVFDPG